MLRFKDNAEPFGQPTKTFKDRFVDLFRKEPISPVKTAPTRSVGQKLEDLFLGQAQEKQPLISPIKERATGKFPSFASAEKIPGWATTSTYNKLQALPEDVKKATTKWQNKLLKNFGGDNVPDAMHVMFMESSGRPHIAHANIEDGDDVVKEIYSPKELTAMIKKYGNVDIGLMQINTIHLPKIKEKFGYTAEDLLDPDKNLEVAAWIWRIQGWNPWMGSRSLALK